MPSQDDWNYTGGYGQTEEQKTAESCWRRIWKWAEERGYRVVRYRSPNKGQFYLDNNNTHHKDWPHYFWYYGWRICQADCDLNAQYWILERV